MGSWWFGHTQHHEAYPDIASVPMKDMCAFQADDLFHHKDRELVRLTQEKTTLTSRGNDLWAQTFSHAPSPTPHDATGQGEDAATTPQTP